MLGFAIQIKGGEVKLRKAFVLLISATIVISAVYALGILDGDGIVRVEGKEFSEFTFSGNMRDGLFDGHGAIHFNDGERFLGNFTRGRFEGEGAFYGLPEFWNFDGYFHVGRIGSGTLQLDSGEVVALERNEATDTLIGNEWRYYGDVDEQGQTGEGKFIFADGSSYIGRFSNGMAYGDGTFTDVKGNITYIGGFSEGLFDGQGKYFSPEGWTYEGGFKAGVFDGEGIITLESETIRGVWEKGVQVARYE